MSNSTKIEWATHVWIGTSVENQPTADERIPELLKIPAKVRFVSVEPMLAPVDLEKAFEIYLRADEASGGCRVCAWPRLKDHIGWVIVGGESGQKARPCNVEWIRDVVRQCRAAGVPCFVKQLGSSCWSLQDDCHCAMSDLGKEDVHWRAHFKHPKGGDPLEWPQDLRVREFPEADRRGGRRPASGNMKG